MLRRRVEHWTLAIAAVIVLLLAAWPATAQKPEPQPGWIGATVESYSEALAKEYDLLIPGGVVVRSVEAEGAAAKAGLKTGDQIVYVGTEGVRDKAAFDALVDTRKAGDELMLSVLSQGKAARKLAVKLDARPRGYLGVDLAEVSADDAKAAGLDKAGGVRLTPRQGSPGMSAGIKSGDIALTVDGSPTPDIASFTTAIGKRLPGAEVKLGLWRDRKPLALALKLGQRPAEVDQPTAVVGPPRLMLDTGGHTALINGLVWTPDGKHVISASDDKVIRVWSALTGRTVRIIRGDMGEGSQGKIYTLALSPDGKLLAAGGWLGGDSGEQIRIFDPATGKLLRSLVGHKNVVQSLAFSPDGRRLISGSSDLTAIIWNLETSRAESVLRGHQGPLYSVAFSPDSQRAMTGSEDSIVRLWHVNGGKLIREMKGHARDIDRALAVSPDGQIIASGDATGEIRLWDGRTGEFLRTLANQSGPVGPLRFSADGKRLMSTCRYTGCEFKNRIWEMASGKEVLSFQQGSNVLAAALSPDGEWIATAGDSDIPIQIWSAAKAQLRKGPNGQPLSPAGHGASIWDVGFAADGSAIAWGTSWPKKLTHMLRLPRAGTTLSDPQILAAPVADTKTAPKADTKAQDTKAPTATGVAAPEFLRGKTKHGDLTLRARKGGRYGRDALLDVLRGDTTLVTLEVDSTTGLQHRSFAFTPDGKTVLSGSAVGNIYVFDLAALEAAAAAAPDRTIKEQQLRKLARILIGHQGDVWTLAPSADSRFLVSGSADKTVRLWNLATLEPIVTLYHGSDGEWVLWTPQGYYSASAKGAEMVGWQISHGPDRESDYVRGQQLRKILNRPDIIDNALRLASANEAVRQAGLTNVNIETLLTQPPPEIRVTTDAESYGGNGRITVTARSTSAALTRLDVFVTSADGQEKKVTPRPAAVTAGARAPEGYGLTAYEIPLFNGVNKIRVVAANASGDSEPSTTETLHNGEGALDQRGTLYVLAVGVDEYPGVPHWCGPTGKETCDLRYAGSDAATFATTMAKRMGVNHSKVDVRLLVGAKVAAKVEGDNVSVARALPTRAAILDALRDLSTKAGANDTVAMFVASHGENWPSTGHYHLLPTDLARTTPGELGRNVLDWQDDMLPLFTKIAGRRLLFLDACHAASARNRTLLNDANASSFTAFQAASGDQLSWEFAEQAHGAFTYVLVEGLHGAKDAIDPDTNAVTVYSLGPYVKRVVQRRTNGQQTPEFTGSDFVLAR